MMHELSWAVMCEEVTAAAEDVVVMAGRRGRARRVALEARPSAGVPRGHMSSVHGAARVSRTSSEQYRPGTRAVCAARRGEVPRELSRRPDDFATLPRLLFIHPPLHTPHTLGPAAIVSQPQRCAYCPDARQH
jgi:hypothetical protein